MSVVIGYTRLSQQSDTSIDTQREAIQTYADEHGFELETIFDDGQDASGFDADDRPAYQHVKQRVREGDIDAVITRDKRRLARDVDEVMRLVPDFRENSVEYHTAMDGRLDLSDPIKAAIEIVSAAVAHEEKQQEIEKAIEATKDRVDDPTVDHGRPRFGMRYNEAGTKQVPGERFDDALEILQRRERGESLREIAEAVGCSSPTVQKVVERREWYVERSQLAER